MITISLFDKGNMKGHLHGPTETEKYVGRKGGNVSFKEVKKRKEFWLFVLSFAIITGISRMMDENLQIVSGGAKNSTAF